uniref:Cadherin domain-containing protein n=1 Tax=Arion vulgaris TaxID=1028688 RepID=A0A0B7AJH0_9EUPU
MMKLRDTILFLMIICIAVVRSQTPPVITTSAVVKLLETQSTNYIITSVRCVDPDGLGVVVSGQVTPKENCNHCFVMSPANVQTGDYNLIFNKSGAALNFNQVPEYNVTLTCDDSVDPVKTKIIMVRLIPNSAAYFDNGLIDFLTVSNKTSIPANTQLYRVAATDPNDDHIYFTMNVIPATNNFEIGNTSGIISTVNDLSQEDNPVIRLEVIISDGRLNTGPLIITVRLYA